MLLAASIVARGQGAPAGAATNGPPALREVRDEIGRAVRVPPEPRHIVSLAPSLTETLFALNLGNRVAGVTDYCDYPAAARTRPHVGGPVNPNLEEIVTLHPDVVLATKELNRRETVEALERLGMAVYTTDPHSVEDVIASTRKLGAVLDAGPRSDELAGSLQQRLDDLEKRLAGKPPVRVFFVVWADPLISVGPGTFLADALRRAGAQSVVDAPQDWPVLSLEELLRKDPAALVFAGAHPDDARTTIAALKQRPGWRNLSAMRDDHCLVVSDAITRPAPRIVDAIEELARQLYPGAFPAPGDKATPRGIEAAS